MEPIARTTMAKWSGGRGSRISSALLRPLVRLLNRPSAAWFGRALYDIALRFNGIAIGFEGKHDVSEAEENFLTRMASRLDGRVVLDVGANNGAYARMVARAAPRAEIHAFEPHPRTFAALQAASPGIRAVNKALGEQEGELELYDFAEADGSTQASLSREAVALFDPNLVAHRVTCTTLDRYMAEAGLERAALLKIDTEGFDLSVLRGAKEAIAAKRFDLIQFEFIPANIATRVTMRDFFEALPGYEIFRLCLNGDLLPLFPYDVKRCEIYVTQNLIARPAAQAAGT